MTKYTTTSLIKELEKFPEDLPIETELAMVYNYDDDKVIEEASGKTFAGEEDLFRIYAKYATELAIFEGSWEEDNISDLNNIIPRYVIGWEVEDHCGQNAILKQDIITAFFQVMHYHGVDSNGMHLFMEYLGLTESVEEVLYKIKAQEKYAKDNKLPLFAPDDGLCFNCGKQIYNKIPLETCETELITHCSYCSRAYND